MEESSEEEEDAQLQYKVGNEHTVVCFSCRTSRVRDAVMSSGLCVPCKSKLSCVPCGHPR
eukprot:9471942-Pyramimonas_sp.AAC.3